MILKHKYEDEIVAIIPKMFLYGSIVTYTNFKRRADEDNMDMNKNMEYTENELRYIFEEIKRV